MTTSAAGDTGTSVQTVTGSITPDDLGVTLPHEHLHNDLRAHAFTPHPDPALREVLAQPVSARQAWLIRENPYHCEDNCALDDREAMLADLCLFSSLGGGTVFDLTPPCLGRDPQLLRALSEDSGVKVVMGSGWYLEKFHGPDERDRPVDQLADDLLADLRGGENGIRPGVIGEIGVSPQFSDFEHRTLRAAAIAQRASGLPLFIHLPGWQRRADEVLAIVLDQENVDPHRVVLCHMDPSWDDAAYQLRLAERGVRLEYDMLGMPFRYDEEGDCPSLGQATAGIVRLVQAGYGDQVLLSHDLFLKAMLTVYGGNGLALVPFALPDRLEAAGIAPAQVRAFTTTNPRTLFV